MYFFPFLLSNFLIQLGTVVFSKHTAKFAFVGLNLQPQFK